MIVRRPSGFIEPCQPSKVAGHRPARCGFTKSTDGYVQGPTARWLRIRRLRQLGLPTVLSGATPLAYAKNRKRPAMERVMEQSFT